MLPMPRDWALCPGLYGQEGPCCRSAGGALVRGAGKRTALRKVSSLGPKGIDMLDVDLSQLVGGESCQIACSILKNGCQVLSSALADSGANIFTLMNTQCAKKLSEFLLRPWYARNHDGLRAEAACLRKACDG